MTYTEVGLLDSQHEVRARTEGPEARSGSSVRPSLIRDLLILGKSNISAMAALTGVTAILIEGNHLGSPGPIAGCAVALFLLGLGANTFNQVFERDRDARMERTAESRPLPSGRRTTRFAVLAASLELLASLLILGGPLASPLAAGLALFTALYYSLFYTLYLKPHSPLSVVYGGVPGAMGPLIAWVAVGGGWSWTPLLLFGLIFVWTPPHAWALAIHLRDDYARAGIPTLPVSRGIESASRQIFAYSVVIVLFSLLMPFLAADDLGPAPVYLPCALLLGGWFLLRAYRLWKDRPRPDARQLFRLSLVHLGVLLLALMADALI